jgi:hypothetical protein
VSVDSIAHNEHSELQNVLKIPKWFFRDSFNYQFLDHKCAILGINHFSLHESKTEEKDVSDDYFVELIVNASDKIWVHWPAHSDPVHLENV